MTNAAHADLDHLFLIVPDEASAQAMMAQAGLRVNYSREHPGQGTRNLCACLDDVFLELLWPDGTEVSPATTAITLAARCRGDGSPLGVSWRGTAPFAYTVPYHAPFLPERVSIPVAKASLDPALPFVFRTPGGTPPIERTDGLVGTRQSPDLTRLGACVISVPNPGPTKELLAPFQQITVQQGPPAMELTLLKPDNTVGRVVRWGMDETTLSGGGARA